MNEVAMASRNLDEIHSAPHQLSPTLLMLSVSFFRFYIEHRSSVRLGSVVEPRTTVNIQHVPSSKRNWQAIPQRQINRSDFPLPIITESNPLPTPYLFRL